MYDVKHSDHVQCTLELLELIYVIIYNIVFFTYFNVKYNENIKILDLPVVHVYCTSTVRYSRFNDILVTLKTF